MATRVTHHLGAASQASFDKNLITKGVMTIIRSTVPLSGHRVVWVNPAMSWQALASAHHQGSLPGRPGEPRSILKKGQVTMSEPLSQEKLAEIEGLLACPL